MTDTAVPLPELPDYTESADDTTFNLDQHRRVEALKVARSILENKPSPFAGTKVEAIRSVGDLTYLADWIIAGPDTDLEPTDIVELRNGAGELVVRIPVTPAAKTEVRTLSDDDLENMNWARRQGYVEGVNSAAQVVDAGGDASTVRSLLDDNIPPEPADDADAAADADHRAARSDADDGN